MKKYLFLLLAMPLFFSACTKEEDPPPTEETKTPEDLLTAHSWKIQELRWVDQGTMYHYLRGTPGNGDIVAVEALTFYTDGTGKTHDNTPLTWQFLDPAKTKLKFTLTFPSGPVTVNWEHLVIKETSMTYGEYWTRATGPSVGFGTRIPTSM